uniref:non-specific serine/threonine protein kinase n=1 Tax=Saccoglossus kowalevskii TaxID=10224 RepID=A0ABM0M979_SACKO|nr:PREDICTED: dual specificity mitogen-activated protein kinase kinase 1-like [Saccoglossus kowalevskii]
MCTPFCLSKNNEHALSLAEDILSALKHPHIVTYYESFFDQGSHLCIVQDYCDGGSLDEKIDTARAGETFLQEHQVMEWFIQIAMAVQYIHSKKILHRDLKTQNVFLTKKGVVKLGDFGIARTLDYTIDKASTCVGTPCYLSPELCQDIPYNNKSDIWVSQIASAILAMPFVQKCLTSFIEERQELLQQQKKPSRPHSSEGHCGSGDAGNVSELSMDVTSLDVTANSENLSASSSPVTGRKLAPRDSGEYSDDFTSSDEDDGKDSSEEVCEVVIDDDIPVIVVHSPRTIVLGNHGLPAVHMEKEIDYADDFEEELVESDPEPDDTHHSCTDSSHINRGIQIV